MKKERTAVHYLKSGVGNAFHVRRSTQRRLVYRAPNGLSANCDEVPVDKQEEDEMWDGSWTPLTLDMIISFNVQNIDWFKRWNRVWKYNKDRLKPATGQ